MVTVTPQRGRRVRFSHGIDFINNIMSDTVHDIVKQTLKEIKNQSFAEKLKHSAITMFASAAGALITILLIAQWNKMDTDAQIAKEKASVVETAFHNRTRLIDAQLSVLIDRIARIESLDHNTSAFSFQSSPAISIDNWEETREQIQSQIDRELYRTEKRH
jgi:hypothetical protein